jgi:hypothetical protein
MSVRHVARRVVVSIAATAAVGTFAALALSSPAGATGPASGSIVPGSAVPVAPFTAGAPFDSGQNINVVIPTNAAFAAPDNTHGVNIVECSAPNGVIPTLPSACDGNTIQGNTILPNADGSFTYQSYTVYALPDSPTLGEGSSGPVCGNTAATECMLYIGNNQNDFTQPHLWSQPFFVKSNGNDLGANPGDGTPEVPLAILLPLSAMGLLGGAVLIRRRHRAAKAAA